MSFDTSQYLNDVKMRNLYKLQQSMTNKKTAKEKYLLQRKLDQAYISENVETHKVKALQPLHPSTSGGDLTYWENPNHPFVKR